MSIVNLRTYSFQKIFLEKFKEYFPGKVTKDDKEFGEVDQVPATYDLKMYPLEDIFGKIKEQKSVSKKLIYTMPSLEILLCSIIINRTVL